MTAAPKTGTMRLQRHTPVDRFQHWLLSSCMLILLATSLLPVLEIKFQWVLIHWVTGILLTAGVLLHVIRVIWHRRIKYMWLGWAEISRQAKTLQDELTGSSNPIALPGKYSTPQKLYHLAMLLVVLLGIGTGLIMLVKIDSPLWQRNPYLLSQEVWGYIYVLHGLSALFSISLIMMHIYFAFRPEKLFYTRSMILGWISADEYSGHHDPALWRPDESNAGNETGT
ncbi:MAG: cytochrome b/b6 domain-containing protein [Pseudomonadales bacterium]|nr:cytochrome b/b6 domain-containing protein [Pseudomonadales bacterium]MDP7360374.1 cytochrome b/b6 domain-containing protein [Pseudomonadales bacterium]MDP7595257.1 cytochrome b/b6 domain-containing protein [Pseudomonadales bacterium]HJN49716.1 cytochrome b/b6 domain-containing protein [Pseudomonadales bacterium]